MTIAIKARSPVCLYKSDCWLLNFTILIKKTTPLKFTMNCFKLFLFKAGQVHLTQIQQIIKCPCGRGHVSVGWGQLGIWLIQWYNHYVHHDGRMFSEPGVQYKFNIGMQKLFSIIDINILRWSAMHIL
jgi:hypothetical protein